MAMAKKAANDMKTKTKEDLVVLAMDLAAQRGWAVLTMRDIAEESGVSLLDLHMHFDDKTDILVALGRQIDRQVLESAGELDDDLSVRDQLFDVLMERFDALNQYRRGVMSVLDSFIPDPKQAVISLPHLCRSMSWMLEAAGCDTTGIKGALKVTGLTGVYLNVLRTWRDDDSPDLSKTMAALDKHLDRSERAMNFLAF